MAAFGRKFCRWCCRCELETRIATWNLCVKTIFALGLWGAMVVFDRYDVWQERFCFVGSIVLDINLNLLLWLLLSLYAHLLLSPSSIFWQQRDCGYFPAPSLLLYLEWRRAVGFPLWGRCPVLLPLRRITGSAASQDIVGRNLKLYTAHIKMSRSFDILNVLQKLVK